MTNGTGSPGTLKPAPTTPTAPRTHGQFPPRGLVRVPSSVSLQGRFGRLFRNAPAFEQNDGELKALAATIIQEDQAGRDSDSKPGAFDEDENPDIPAGYTYLGQFIDHDITFDPVSSLQRQNDPDALEDFRTPRFDLDSVYGRGPADQPYLYDENDNLTLLLGASASEAAGPDLLRTNAERALIGDPRNDENLIVSQLQTVFIRFHNQMLKKVRNETSQNGQKLDDEGLFKEVQRLVRWHYQWVVIHDFLPRILGGTVGAGQQIVQDILGVPNKYVAGLDKSGQPIMAQIIRPRLLFYHWRSVPYIPVEFSAAAYRFGHSMVRPSYFFNDKVTLDPGVRKFGRTPIFSRASPAEKANLNGFRKLPDQWGFQWKYFFELNEQDESKRPEKGPLPQRGYKIDAELAGPLGTLPAKVGSDPSSLAERNLLRGKSLALPPGEWVARAMGITPLTPKDLNLDKFPSLKGNSPLWYYVLKEAEICGDSRHLGPVGGRIVAEVLIGLMSGDALSYLNVQPNWTPELAKNNIFGMPELIKFATQSG